MTLIDKTKSSLRTSLNVSSHMYRMATNQARLLPDFLIIGGQRCGTSSLYYYLTEHPGIISSSTKETHFFDEEFHNGTGWYRSHFPTALYKNYIQRVRKQEVRTGEGTPYYILYPHTPKRVAQLRPHMKLIALLRNPVDRAYSQYWIEVKARYETWSFEDAIRGEKERVAGELEKMLKDENYYSFSYRHFAYVDRGIYVDQLQRWREYFSEEQLLVLKSEDLYKDPAAVMKQTLDFLEVESGNLNKEYKNYRRPSKKGYKHKEVQPPIDPAMRQYLVDYYKPHNQRLYDFLGVDFGWS